MATFFGGGEEGWRGWGVGWGDFFTVDLIYLGTPL